MTRTIHATMLADLAEAGATQVALIELQFAGGTTRITTGATTVSWNALTWTAVGGALSVPELADTTDDLGQGVPIQLSGVDQSMLALVLSEGYRGRLCKVWHAHINATSGLVLADPILMFAGYMNAPFSVSEDYPESGGGTVSIATRVTSRFAEFTQPHGFRCNVESHSAILASLGLLGAGERDTFFSTVAGLPGRKIYWGSRNPAEIRIPEPGPGGHSTPGGGTVGNPYGPQTPNNPWGPQTPYNPWGSQNTSNSGLIGGGGGPSTGRLP